TIPSSWVSGIYAARLNGSNGTQSLVYFVVRDDGGHEAILVKSSVNTAEAYNVWGGTSMYQNTTNGSGYKYAHAVKGSFDRPFEPTTSEGMGQYINWEYAFVQWVESQGYDVAYETDVDADSSAPSVTNHKAVVAVGHDEYWTAGERNAFQTAVNS